jgi:hypothetical protein
MKYIPSTQCISPFAAFHKWNIQANSIFPFNQRSLKYFYFARNGIYYLGKRLKEAGYKKVLFPAYNHGNEIKALLSAGLELNYYRVIKNQIKLHFILSTMSDSPRILITFLN